MRTINHQNLKLAAVLMLLVAALAQAQAQKLPSVQNNGLYMPPNVKIDGNATGWKQFQAFNKSNNIYYAIANDESNLYLAVQTTDVHAIEKILAGGLTFTLKNKDTKSTAAPVAITYPILDPKDRFAIVPKLKEEGDTRYVKTDVNTQFKAAAKEIEVKGINAVADTLLSIYNNEGISAAAAFGDPKAFTYELRIPLKYLKDRFDLTSAFGYNIKLNSPRIKQTITPGGPVVIRVTSVRIGSRAADEMQDLQNATDFSGNYTLAKK